MLKTHTPADGPVPNIQMYLNKLKNIISIVPSLSAHIPYPIVTSQSVYSKPNFDGILNGEEIFSKLLQEMCYSSTLRE